MGRLTDLGSYIGEGGSGGIRGLSFLDSPRGGIAGEIIGSYQLTLNGTNMSANINGVLAGDTILICMTSDNVGPSSISGYTQLHSHDNSAHLQVYGKAITASGDESISFSATDAARTSAVILHVRGINLTGFTLSSHAASEASDFYIPALAASAGPRLVLVVGGLDDDRISTQSDQSVHGYTSQGASASSSIGSSTHVWTKFTDGSAETSKVFSMSGGEDQYGTVIMGFNVSA